MAIPARFSPDILAALEKSNSLRIRAGSQHRFIAIWMVVIDQRLFVRSWSRQPKGWYRSFLEDPLGAIQIARREIPIRAVHTRSERALQAVDRAYLEKYKTPGAIRYARDLVQPKCRQATLEFVPLRTSSDV